METSYFACNAIILDFYAWEPMYAVIHKTAVYTATDVLFYFVSHRETLQACHRILLTCTELLYAQSFPVIGFDNCHNSNERTYM